MKKVFIYIGDLLAFTLQCALIFLLFGSNPNPQGISVDDLLIPETSSPNDISRDDQPLFQNSQGAKNVDDLLGPEDNFPFLPDNHRDSGTGKFNSF